MILDVGRFVGHGVPGEVQSFSVCALTSGGVSFSAARFSRRSSRTTKTASTAQATNINAQHPIMSSQNEPIDYLTE
jgi:hypothetical protein